MNHGNIEFNYLIEQLKEKNLKIQNLLKSDEILLPDTRPYFIAQISKYGGIVQHILETLRLYYIDYMNDTYSNTIELAYDLLDDIEAKRIDTILLIKDEIVDKTEHLEIIKNRKSMWWKNKEEIL